MNKINLDEMIKGMTIQEACEVGRRIGRGESTQSKIAAEGRIAIIETNNKKMSEDLKELKLENITEHKEIKILVKELTTEIRATLKEKADKTEVDGMKQDLLDLKTWMWKAIGVVATILFIVSFFKEEIINSFKV
jgi:hypothetical protein